MGGPLTLAAIYVTIWWTILFAILPLGNVTHAEAGVDPQGGDPGAPVVIADGNQLEVAILNLGINARDAMPDGGSLTISTTSDPDDPHKVLVAVTDTGTGMPPNGRSVPSSTSSGSSRGASASRTISSSR